MKRSIWVGKYLGIDVYLHYSWFFIFALLAWALSSSFFPQKFPDQSIPAYWGLGIFSALLLFVSVLLHELSHSVIARRNGLKVENITLFFFGGMASAHEQHISPKKEFQMAIAGPMMSLFIASVFLVIYNITDWFYVAAVASYLYRINMILAIFNLVPGFPLDGGRVLRSVIWYWTNDFRKATRIATTGGKMVAYVLVFMGFVSVFAGNFGGMWLVVLGFFLLILASMSYEQIVIKDALSGRKVADFTDHKFPSISPDTTVRDAVVKHFLKKDATSFAVVKGSEFLGIVSVDDVQKLPKKQWVDLKVSDVMLKGGRVPKVALNTGAYAALISILKSGVDFLPVTGGKGLLGIVRRDDLLRYVKLKTTKEKLEKMGFDTG
ncbi:site-2 protease family protein [Candidatus Woesearchaeota archaeon]|nr:site-2 protease family protein [Candidatus Woesearchaeota archaeon]